MKPATLPGRAAVCSWSLQPQNPDDLVDKLQTVGVRRVQLALDPLREAPGVWGETGNRLRSAGIEIVSGMFGCIGEDYSTLESIQRTGGIAPDHTWEANWNNIQKTAVLAASLGIHLVTFHAGFLPHEESDPDYRKLQDRLLKTAGIFQEHNAALALETGQETAEALAGFLRALKTRNVGINFDPANMILYDKGDPIQALRVLGPRVRQVHIKDARRTRTPGQWGEEVVAGTGEVNWPAFFSVLAEVRFDGDLCIEREAGDQRVSDVRQAFRMLQTLSA